MFKTISSKCFQQIDLGEVAFQIITILLALLAGVSILVLMFRLLGFLFYVFGITIM
jgi:hypothetical protein